QANLDELAGAFTSAFDTISQAMAQAFVQGQGAAVNWANVMKAVVQQVISEFLKLSILNPLLNGLFGKDLPTIAGVGGLFGGEGLGSGGTSAGSGGLLQLLGLGATANSIFGGGSGSLFGGSGFLGLGSAVPGVGFFGQGLGGLSSAELLGS